MARRTAEAAVATRQDLLKAALRIFSEDGYTAATLEQIARRAGVTRGALYHHFEGKADLYDALLREEADQVMRPLMAGLANDGPPFERLRRFFISYGTALEGDARFRAILAILMFGSADVPEPSRSVTRRGYQAWLDVFEAVLEEAHSRGELRTGLSPRMAASAVVALTAGMTTTALQARSLMSPSESAPLLFDVLLGGIAK